MGGGLIINHKSKRVTVYDIAKMAGVSVSSVSKALKADNYKVSKETRDKISTAAQTLNYDKLPLERIGRGKKQSEPIIVIVPNITNPYYASLITGLEYALKQEGMSMILYNTGSSQEAEKQYVYSLANSHYQGVIIVSICEEHGHIEKLLGNGVRVVAIEQHVELDCNRVGFHYFRGGEMAVEYLASKGKERIAFISSPLVRASRNQVYQGYLSGLKKSGLIFQKEYVKIGKGGVPEVDELFDYANGVRQMEKLLQMDQLPDAVFCINDVMAIGVLNALKIHGYQVPQDIGVMGFDNICFSGMLTPGLTTIEQPTYEIGTMAAEILIGGFHDKNRNNITVSLEPKLIVRESV